MNEIFVKELECIHAEAESGLSKIALQEVTFTESALFDKVSDTVEAIIEQVEAFFRAIKEKLSQFINRFRDRADTWDRNDSNYKTAYNICVGAYRSYCSHMIISINSYERNHDDIGLAQTSEIIYSTACRREVDKALEKARKLKVTQQLLLANDISDALNKESKIFMNKMKPYINKRPHSDPDRTRLYLISKKSASLAMEIGNKFSSIGDLE